MPSSFKMMTLLCKAYNKIDTSQAVRINEKRQVFGWDLKLVYLPMHGKPSTP